MTLMCGESPAQPLLHSMAASCLCGHAHVCVYRVLAVSLRGRVQWVAFMSQSRAMATTLNLPHPASAGANSQDPQALRWDLGDNCCPLEGGCPRNPPGA